MIKQVVSTSKEALESLGRTVIKSMEEKEIKEFKELKKAMPKELINMLAGKHSLDALLKHASIIEQLEPQDKVYFLDKFIDRVFDEIDPELNALHNLIVARIIKVSTSTNEDPQKLLGKQLECQMHIFKHSIDRLNEEKEKNK